MNIDVAHTNDLVYKRAFSIVHNMRIYFKAIINHFVSITNLSYSPVGCLDRCISGTAAAEILQVCDEITLVGIDATNNMISPSPLIGTSPNQSPNTPRKNLIATDIYNV